jgi:hypothetical protein
MLVAVGGSWTDSILASAVDPFLFGCWLHVDVASYWFWAGACDSVVRSSRVDEFDVDG